MCHYGQIKSGGFEDPSKNEGEEVIMEHFTKFW